MKSRVCFVGDSHVAALRQALDDPGCEQFLDRLTIFGSQGKTLDTVELVDNHIVSDEKRVRRNFKLTGGRKFIDLDAFDAFCVVGCQMEMDLVEPLYSTFAPVEMGLKRRQPVSSALFDIMLQEIFKTTIAYKLVNMLAQSGKPVYQILNARYSDEILEHSKGKFFQELIDSGADGKFLERFRKAVDVVFGPTAIMIEQPPSTFSPPMFTSPTFSSGSKRLGKGLKEHPEDDFHHMNAEYGALMLSRAFELIDGKTK